MPRYMSDKEWYERQNRQRRDAYLTESANDKIKEKKIKKEKEEEDEKTRNYYDKSKKSEKIRESYVSFKNKLKDTLLSESIYYIYSRSVPNIMLESITKKGMDVENMERGFVEDFIREQGSPEKILRKWRTKNSFLSEIASIIDSTYEDILESVDKDEPETYGLPTHAKNQFYSQLSQATPDEVVDTIKSRVMNSIELFLDENRELKNAITDIYNSAESKKNVTTDDDTLKESYEHNLKYIGKVNEIKRNRQVGVFSEMVKLVAKNIVLDDNLRPQYINEETNRIDMDAIVDSTAIMFTFLETCNTIKLADVNHEYIQNIFNEMEETIHEAAKKKKKKEKKDDSNELDSKSDSDKSTDESTSKGSKSNSKSSSSKTRSDSDEELDD